jgi:hypothetical protein
VANPAETVGTVSQKPNKYCLVNVSALHGLETLDACAVGSDCPLRRWMSWGPQGEQHDDEDANRQEQGFFYKRSNKYLQSATAGVLEVRYTTLKSTAKGVEALANFEAVQQSSAD